MRSVTQTAATHLAFSYISGLVHDRADYRAELSAYRARVQAAAELRKHIAYCCKCGLPPRLAMQMLNAILEEHTP